MDVSLAFACSKAFIPEFPRPTLSHVGAMRLDCIHYCHRGVFLSAGTRLLIATPVCLPSFVGLGLSCSLPNMQQSMPRPEAPKVLSMECGVKYRLNGHLVRTGAGRKKVHASACSPPCNTSPRRSLLFIFIANTIFQKFRSWAGQKQSNLPIFTH